MNSSIDAKHAILQRRSSISDLRAVLDGFAVVGLSYWLIIQHVGAVTAEYTVMVVLLLGTLGLLYDSYAIYRKNASFTRKALDLFQAWTLAFAALLALGFLTKQSDSYSRLLLGQLYVTGYFAQLILHGLMRLLVKEVFRHTTQADNTIIVGTGQLAGYLNQRIAANEWLGQRVVGFVGLGTSDGTRDGEPSFGTSAAVLGRLEQLMDLIDQHQVRTVYFAIPLNASDVIESLYFRLLDKHVAVHWVPDIFSLRLVNHAVSEIAGIPVLTLSETPLIGTRRLLKLAEDACLSALLLVLLAPLMLLIAAAIRLDSQGPVFFRQARLGWGGKTFHIWKFRSMYVHQPTDGVVQQAMKNDPRVTRVGAFLRRSSLDELPQIFNVLRGEMSLVGPRPHAIQHDHEYARHISHYFARHNIKPGITGLAQVRGFRGETQQIEKMIMRVESDIEYINHWSLWLDLSILVRTLKAFTGSNAY
jgi:putative colanic acid biosynthesis UDP-glucose lipid carrier transferase